MNRPDLLDPTVARQTFGPYNDFVVTLLRDGVLAGCIEIEAMSAYSELHHWITISPYDQAWAWWRVLAD